MAADRNRPAPAPDILGRAPSLADTLASRLHDEIVSGRLKSGERLPTEQQLARAYGVSRPIVREAVGRLKHDGLVLSRQGAGVFVADPLASSVFRLEVADFTDNEEIRNIIELLMAVEASATEHTASRGTQTDFAVIGARLDAMQEAIRRGESGVEEDVAFHRAIIDATGNPYFRDLSEFLDRRVRKFIRTARENSARLAGMVQLVQREHQDIYDAIIARDPPRARLAAETHLKNAAQRLSLYLGH